MPRSSSSSNSSNSSNEKKASRQLQEDSYHNGTLVFARSEFHTRIFAYSTQTHAPLNLPSDPTLLAFGIPKHFRESEMNNNNIPPSEDLHNTHMRRYELKSEDLLNIHPRLSKKTCPTYLYIIAYKEETRIPACGVVLYMEVGSH